MFMESYISGLLHLCVEILSLGESTLEKIVPQGLMRNTEYEVFMIPFQKIEFIALIYISLSKIKYRN